MKLFLVHCGFTDKSFSCGVYESHTNFFVVASSFAEAKKSAKRLPEFRRFKMHIDSLQEIEVVDGFRIKLQEIKSLSGVTRIHYKNPWTRLDS